MQDTKKMLTCKKNIDNNLMQASLSSNIYPITNLSSLQLLLNFIRLSVHTLWAVVLYPLLGVVCHAGTCLLSRNLTVDRYCWCWCWCCWSSSKLRWGTGDCRCPTQSSLAQQTTQGQLPTQPTYLNMPQCYQSLPSYLLAYWGMMLTLSYTKWKGVDKSPLLLKTN